MEKSLSDRIEQGLDIARTVSPLMKVTGSVFGSFVFLNDVLRLGGISTAGYLTCKTRLGRTQALDDRSTWRGKGDVFRAGIDVVTVEEGL